MEKSEVDEVVRRIAAEMLDGRAIGGVRMAGWREDLREVVPQAVGHLAEQRAGLANVTDLQIGQMFAGRMRELAGPRGFGGYADPSYVEWGAYLRRQAALFEGKAEGVPEFPAAQRIVGHTSTHALVKAWADNDEHDVKDGVDEQGTYLRSLNAEMWPACCTSNSEAKDFLGRAMDYKRARLAISGSESEPVIDLTEPTSMSVLEMAEEMRRLHTEVETLTTKVNDLTAEIAVVRQRHAADIERIGERLMQEADERDWCDEYDRVVDSLNRNLTIGLPSREDREKDTYVEVSGYIRVPFCITVTVTHAYNADESDIEQQAGEMVENNYGASELLSSYANRSDAEVEDDFEYSVQ